MQHTINTEMDGKQKQCLSKLNIYRAYFGSRCKMDIYLMSDYRKIYLTSGQATRGNMIFYDLE